MGTSAPVTHVVALSGGKDSSALALRMQEVWPDLEPVYLCTPTGNELPDMEAHWANLERLLGKPLTRLSNGSLESWMGHWNMLPHTRMRWCTRVLKIEPALAWLRAHLPAIQYVGLRADEPAEARSGLEATDVECRFPLREWGWTVRDVRQYLAYRGVTIPERTDCAWCPFQRLGEWYRLATEHPDLYEQAEQWEARTGHTFRRAGEDSKPVALGELKLVAPGELEKIRVKKWAAGLQGSLFPKEEEDEETRHRKCRVCSL